MLCDVPILYWNQLPSRIDTSSKLKNLNKIKESPNFLDLQI